MNRNQQLSDTHDRSVSFQLSYLLSFVIATILIGSLTVSVGGLVDQQHTRSTQQGLSVSGDKIAAQMMSADRAVQSQPDTELKLTPSIPEEIAGSQYYIQVVSNPSGPSYIELQSMGEDVTARVPVMFKAQVYNGTAISGDVSIKRTDGYLHLSYVSTDNPESVGTDGIDRHGGTAITLHGDLEGLGKTDSETAGFRIWEAGEKESTLREVSGETCDNPCLYTERLPVTSDTTYRYRAVTMDGESVGEIRTFKTEV